MYLKNEESDKAIHDLMKELKEEGYTDESICKAMSAWYSQTTEDLSFTPDLPSTSTYSRYRKNGSISKVSKAKTLWHFFTAGPPEYSRLEETEDTNLLDQPSLIKHVLSSYCDSTTPRDYANLAFFKGHYKLLRCGWINGSEDLLSVSKLTIDDTPNTQRITVEHNFEWNGITVDERATGHLYPHRSENFAIAPSSNGCLKIIQFCRWFPEHRQNGHPDQITGYMMVISGSAIGPKRTYPFVAIHTDELDFETGIFPREALSNYTGLDIAGHLFNDLP